METYGLEKLGIINAKAVYRNLTPAQLTEHALCRGEGTLSNTCLLYTSFPAANRFAANIGLFIVAESCSAHTAVRYDHEYTDTLADFPRQMHIWQTILNRVPFHSLFLLIHLDLIYTLYLSLIHI